MLAPLMSYLIPLILATFITSVLAISIFQQRGREPKIKVVVLLLVSGVIWMVTYAFEIWSTDLTFKIFWKKTKYFGILSAPTLWFIYTLYYSGREKWLNRQRYLLLCIVPVTTILLVFTNEFHRLVWSDLTLVRGEGFSQLSHTYGIWLWILVIYTYLLVLSGCLVLARIYLQQRRHFRRQIILIIFVAVILISANIAERLGFSPFTTLDLEPFAFGFAIFFIALAYFRWGLGDITPVAHKAIMESMSEGVIVIDLQNRIVELNAAAQNSTGIQSSAAIGKPVDQIWPGWPEDLKPPYIGAAWLKEIGIKKNGQDKIFDFHLSHLKGNDDRLMGYVIVLHDMTDIKKAEENLRNAHDKMEQMVLERTLDLQSANVQMKQEIEERKQIEEALWISEERYALATNAAMVGVWDWNVKTNSFYLDPNVKAILGYEDDEIPNDLDIWATYVHPDDKQSVMEAFQAHIEKKTPEFLFEHRMLHKDGSVRWIRARGKAIWDLRGNAIRVVGTDADITRQKEVEMELLKAKKKEATGILARGIAHDFNTLLSVITGNLAMLRKEVKIDDSVSDLLAEIEKASLQAQDLTQKFMTFSSGDEPVRKQTRIHPLIDTVIRSNSYDPEVIYEVVLPENLWSIEIDKKQITQVFHNLLENSRDAMPSGGKIIIIGKNKQLESDSLIQGRSIRAGRFVEITIKDNGLGIPKSDLANVFDPYYSTKDNVTQKGLGLGLTIAHAVIEKHNGYIFLDSEPQAGTEVHIYLPTSKN
jgi:PAS domain S-box-containing protein